MMSRNAHMQVAKPVKVSQGKSFLVRAIATGQREVASAVAKRKEAEAKAMSVSTLRF